MSLEHPFSFENTTGSMQTGLHQPLFHPFLWLLCWALSLLLRLLLLLWLWQLRLLLLLRQWRLRLLLLSFQHVCSLASQLCKTLKEQRRIVPQHPWQSRAG